MVPAHRHRYEQLAATGGSTDALACAVGQGMSATLGQRVIVENKPGPASNLEAAAAKAAPDGYTLAIVDLPHAMAPSLVLNLTCDLRRDFVPISLIGTSLLMLFTNPVVASHASVQAWVADARAKPGALAIAHSGNGSIRHLAGSTPCPLAALAEARLARSGALAYRLSRSVVTVKPRRRLVPRMSCVLISLATRFRLTTRPWSINSARTRGMP